MESRKILIKSFKIEVENFKILSYGIFHVDSNGITKRFVFCLVKAVHFI